MQNMIHPALLDASIGKSSNILLVITSLLSLIAEVIGIGALFAIGGGLVGVIALVFPAYTILSLLYLLVWSEDKKKQTLPCLRTAVVVYGVILYIPLAYPGIPFIFLFGIFGGFYQPVYWIVIFAMIVIYHHITAFMILVGRDHKKLITDLLTQLDMQRTGYTQALAPQQQFQYQQQYQQQQQQ